MEYEYLVRGAMLYCDKGSHPRRLNLPKCHGVYFKGKPAVRKDDCVAEDNITYFGVCTSDSPPDKAEEVVLSGHVLKGESPDRVKDACGMKCSPDIIGEWRAVNKRANITGEFAAVTTDSYLVCSCGGLIKAATSGQEYQD